MKFFTRIALVLACAAAPLTAADTVELKQRWIAGKQYFYSTETSQQSTISIGEQKIEQAVTMTMDMSVAVRPHEDGKRKRMVIVYDRVAMDMTMAGQKLSYDSAAPDASTDPLGLSKSLGLMVGKELKVLTNEQDEVTEVENYEEYVKQVTPAGGPGAMDMSKTFTRDAMLQTMKQGSLQAFPGRPVSQGQIWPFSNQLVLPQIGSVNVRGNYTYKGTVQREGVACEEISTSGTIAMELNPATEGDSATSPAALGMKVTEGSIKGPVWFDTKLGTARESDLTQEMVITMKNPVDAAATLTVPMKQSIKTKLTKVEDLK